MAIVTLAIWDVRRCIPVSGPPDPLREFGMTKAKERAPRLGTIARGATQRLYDARGHAKSNLWLSYSIKNRRNVAFIGNLNYLHFLHCESDPNVVSVDYEPAAREVEVADEIVTTGLTAEVITGAAVLELREVRGLKETQNPANDVYLQRHLEDRRHELRRQFERREVATARDFRTAERKLLTERDLYVGHEMRLRNWSRLIPWVAQAQFHSLAMHRSLLLSCMRVGTPMTAGDIMLLGEGDSGQAALFLAAAIEGASLGHWATDLDDQPFSRTTTFEPRCLP
jgi:hypothetical protein